MPLKRHRYRKKPPENPFDWQIKTDNKNQKRLITAYTRISNKRTIYTLPMYI